MPIIQKINWLLVISYFSMAVATILALFVGSVHFTRPQRKKYPFLRIFDGKQVHMVSGVILFCIVATVTQVWKEKLLLEPSISQITAPNGTLVPLATSTAIHKELLKAAAAKISEAERHFDSGTSAFTHGDYRTAVSEFSESLAILPTASAYLNR